MNELKISDRYRYLPPGEPIMGQDKKTPQIVTISRLFVEEHLEVNVPMVEFKDKNGVRHFLSVEEFGKHVVEGPLQQ